MDKSISLNRYDYYVLDEIKSSTKLRKIYDIVDECDYRNIVSFVSNLEILTEGNYDVTALINYPPKRNNHHSIKSEIKEALEYNINEIELYWLEKFIYWDKQKWSNITTMCIEEGVEIRIMLETADTSKEDLTKTLKFLKSKGINKITTSTGLKPNVITPSYYKSINELFNGFEVKVIANIKKVNDAQKYFDMGASLIATSVNLIGED